MPFLKGLVIAFSMYSKIPMPQFAWKEEDMKYMLCFFPWVGAVTGVLLYGWRLLCDRLGVGELCYVCVGGAIPLIVTGGFHADGFLDTMDAFHSYQTRERKLEILKDSHIGAFAVIMAGVYGLIYLAAFSEIRNRKMLAIFACGFVLSRVFSGIGVIAFRPAKTDGLLFRFADSAHKKVVFGVLCVEGVLCFTGMLFINVVAGAVVGLTALAAFGYYRVRCYKEFGGITGDTAGYFILLSEVCMALAAALLNLCEFL